jgi:hypothetical protein
MKHTFTAPVTIWITKYSDHDADSLQSVDSASDMSILDPRHDFSDSGYTKVGEGTLTCEIYSRDEIITGKAGALRAELANDRAQSQKRQNALMQKISELEALTYEPAGA